MIFFVKTKISFLLFCLGVSSVNAQVLINPNFGEDVYLSEDAIVEAGTWIKNGNLIIENNLLIENYGKIDTDVFLDSADLFIKNSGDLRSNFYLSSDANVYQVISETNDFNLIDFNVSYGLIIQDVKDGIEFAKLTDFAVGAKSISVKNAVLDFRGATLSVLRNLNLSLDGVIIIELDDLSGLVDNVLLDNIDGNAQVFLRVDNQDGLYSSTAYVRDGKLYVEQNKEEDYKKVFDEDTSEFLENLDVAETNNELMDKINSADTLADVYKVMNESVLFNYEKLIYPIKVLNAVNKNKYNHTESGVSAFGVFDSDFGIYGLDLDFVVFDNDKFSLFVGGQVAYLDYVSDLDSFDAKTYGVELGLTGVVWNGVFVDAKIAYNMTKFDVGDVLYDGAVYNNPSARSGFMVADMGYKIFLNDFVSVSPFVGADFTVFNVENYRDSKVRFRGGAEMLYTHETMGLRYKYGARVVGSDNEIVASVFGQFWSIMDLVGGNIELSAVHVCDKFSGQISVGFNIEF